MNKYEQYLYAQPRPAVKIQQGDRLRIRSGMEYFANTVLETTVHHGNTHWGWNIDTGRYFQSDGLVNLGCDIVAVNGVPIYE